MVLAFKIWWTVISVLVVYDQINWADMAISSLFQYELYQLLAFSFILGRSSVILNIVVLIILHRVLPLVVKLRLINISCTYLWGKIVMVALFRCLDALPVSSELPHPIKLANLSSYLLSSSLGSLGKQIGWMFCW